jgi:CDP-diacylglycerol pyrophosphatase
MTESVRYRLPGKLAGIAAITGALSLTLFAGGSLAQPPAARSATVTRVGQAGKNPNALWQRVKRCRKQKKFPSHGCLWHSTAHQYVVLKDEVPHKSDAYLLLPTYRVPGIESPLVFRKPLVNFWDYGFAAAGRFVKGVAKPHQQIGMAINSAFSRSQNQLHIHLSCASQTALRALAKATIGYKWAPKPFLHVGHQVYNVRKTRSLHGQSSPFVLVSQIPAAKGRMKYQTIGVIGASGHGYWYVLDDFKHGSDLAAAEGLLNESC